MSAGQYKFSLFPDANSEQKRAYSYFQQNTAPTLAAFTDITLPYWMFSVPRFAVDDPAIFHCMVAVAARHMASPWRGKDTASAHTGDRLRDIELSSDSYSRALRILVPQQSCTVPERHLERLHIILTCCAMFIGYESVADPTATSDVCLTHMISGFRILQQVEINEAALPKGEEALMIFNTNRAIFGQVAVMLPFFTVPQKLKQPQHHVRSHQIIFPTSFKSTQEARASFISICRCYWQSMAAALKAGNASRCRLSGNPTVFDRLAPAVSKTKAQMMRWWELFTLYNRSLEDSSNSDANTDLERRKCQGYLTQFLILSNALRVAIDPAAIEACGTILTCVDATNSNNTVSTFRVVTAFPTNVLKELADTPKVISGDEWLWPSFEVVDSSGDECTVTATMVT